VFYAILVVLLIQAATLGISDDEAYYWVLAQSPMLGFSYHPGGVVWSIWISEKLFGFLPWRELVVRLPAIAMISGMLFEFRSMAGKDRDGRLDWILAAGGIWAVSWLMVPDPLLI
jgi:4-amino-4-deoxy-L-arabinose transferase-like glycosyltransferase